MGGCQVVCFDGGSIVHFSVICFRGYIAEICVVLFIFFIGSWRGEEISGRGRVLEILLRDGNGSVQCVERLIDLA
jgi:hypothetical protein